MTTLDPQVEAYLRDPDEFFETAQANADAIIDLTLLTAGATFNEGEQIAAKIGVAAGVTAAVSLLAARNMLAGQS